jgi:predicted nucleic acid-binding protein
LIIVDTSGLLAALNPDDPRSVACQAVLTEDSGPRLLSPFVLAELDYLLSTRSRAVDANVRFLDEVVKNRYLLPPFDSEDVGAARDIVRHHRQLRIGLAAASLVVLADRYKTNRILTLDERHFRALRPQHAKSFVLLPADAP